VSEHSQPSLSSLRATSNPGVPFSTMNIDTPREGFAAGSVRAATK
jgi:hypothetical protein